MYWMWPAELIQIDLFLHKMHHCIQKIKQGGVIITFFIHAEVNPDIKW